MTAKQPVFPNSRQQAFLTGLADEQLAKEDAKAALLTAGEAAKEALTRKRLQAGERAIKSRSARLAAVAKAEKAAIEFTDAVAEMIAHAADERKHMGVGSPGAADLLTPAALKRRISRYLSRQLRVLGSPVEPRFGEIVLAQYYRASCDWTTAEKRVTASLPGGEGNGADGG